MATKARYGGDNRVCCAGVRTMQAMVNGWFECFLYRQLMHQHSGGVATVFAPGKLLANRPFQISNKSGANLTGIDREMRQCLEGWTTNLINP